MSLVSRIFGLYRIDNVPWALKPAFYLYGYALGIPCALYALLVRSTSRIVIEREPGADERARAVFCAWHEHVWCQFISLQPLGRYTVLSHPLWYMEPVYVMLRSLGLRRFAWGSAGNSGRAAAERMIEFLRENASLSAVINPDGPAGPPRRMKKGALHIAARTGLPIVPLRFESSLCLRMPGWDRKKLPLPFGRIRIRVGAPIQVQGTESLEDVATLLESTL